MKKVKKLLCVLLAVAMILSLCVTGLTAQAVATETAETGTAYPESADDFTWDNATVYFLLTDRFNNGNTSNDHSYNRGLNQDGTVSTVLNDVASFQGGDFKGITQKIKEGYFDDLGINAIWVAGWVEQIHGYIVGGDGKSSFAHYAYHGYYAADFSELDANYGTEAEFKEMIDTAHEHGIRVVMDVVMNHPGYNTIYDMAEYNFGTLKSGWEDVYYNYSKINQSTYHGVIDYNTNSADWGNWWGSDWMRAGLAGYTQGYGDLEGSQTYLPDFKTESTSTVSLPTYLQTKWKQEGTYNTKVSELNETFSKYNLGSKTVRNYLVAWYAQWVEEFGIDGFRCDTAKHVEQESWKALSTACTKALENWRDANPNAAGADWDEEFWMTGENFGQGVDYNEYYQNGFDSMINFSFSGTSTGANCNGMLKSGNINDTYADYANRINTNDNFNVLTYISSHDTGLCRDDLYYQGSALLLMPGGVQIFYGDETNRQYVDCSIHDHEMRSMMNWSSIASSSSSDSKVLAHWQKVGTFRNNHVAVGAGSHTTLSATSGSAFARSYTKNNVNDKVACVIGANANTNVTITLNNTFANGTVVRNAYDGTTATVANGKVTFNSGANGTILVEEVTDSGSDTQPTSTTPTTAPTTSSTEPVDKPTTPDTGDAVYVLLGDADLSEKVNVKDATAVQKYVASIITFSDKAEFAANVDGNDTVNVKDATAIQKYCASIETGYAIAQNVLYSGSVDPVEPTSTTPSQEETKATDPVEVPTTDSSDGTVDLTQLDGMVIVLINSTYDTPYTHTWTDGGDAYDSWPGTAMQSLGNGMYYALVNENANRIIFNCGSNADQTDNLTIPGNFAIYDASTGSWSGYLSDYVDVTKFPLDQSLLPDTGTDTGTDPTEPTPSGNYIYLKDYANWGNCYAHMWENAGDAGITWPGYQMESVGNNIYKIEIPADKNYNRVVFNNGGNGQQSGDLVIEIGKAYNNQTQQWEDVE